MQPFKRGAFLLAEELSLPVVPLTIDGAYNLLPKDGINIHPGKVTLTIHRPITPPADGKYDLEQLMKESYNRIASALPNEKPIE
jgi:1-acyl-sn-glycerol-3-phosphate acyltransferase